MKTLREYFPWMTAEEEGWLRRELLRRAGDRVRAAEALLAGDGLSDWSIWPATCMSGAARVGGRWAITRTKPILTRGTMAARI